MKPEYDITPERAIELVSAAASAMPIERLEVAAAAGRVLRADLHSLVDRPAADDSALDGFACRVVDTLAASDESPVNLDLIGAVAAGTPYAGAVAPGQAVRIATGGLMPTGADGVIGVEHAEAHRGTVMISRPASGGAVRSRGQDLLAGSRYLRSGARLDSAGIGLAAAMGHEMVPVSRRPRLVIITTGNEVVAPGHTPSLGQLYDANGSALAAAASRAGCDIVAIEYVPDDTRALGAALGNHREGELAVDLIVTSGGVSRGEHDVVRDVLLAEDDLAFWRVAVRPAGPTMFGHFQGVPVLGLPGNPVSSLVGFMLFGRAFVDGALCSSAPLPYFDRLPVRLSGDFSAQVKTVLHRAHLEVNAVGGIEARPFDNQSSGVLRSLVEADALVVTGPRGSAETLAGGSGIGSAIELRKHL